MASKDADWVARRRPELAATQIGWVSAQVFWGRGVRRRHWTHTERPVSGWSSLTDTERNVAALAAQGLTNPQVATQMFVSPHTVKFHLRQVFRKLGIGSRVELARPATEHTPGGDPPEV